jgi:hypothetical protein
MNLALILLVISVLLGEHEPATWSISPRFHVILPNDDTPLPWRRFPITLRATGRLPGMRGLDIEKEDLPGLLRPDDHPTLATPPCCLVLILEKNDRKSRWLLCKLLTELFLLSDPGRSTTIYVKGVQRAAGRAGEQQRH